jgi:hypothetical protein
MNTSLLKIHEGLRSAGVIAADANMPPREDNHRPWFIVLLQGFAGWLAGIFLLVFLGLVFRPDELASIMALGVVLLVAAWVIYRLDREAVFLDQFALAISIAGQLAIAWSVVEEDFDPAVLAGALLVLQVVVWLVMPNKVARTLAALFATIAWVYVIRFLVRPADSGEEALGFAHGSEASARFGSWTLPLGWLLTWVPLLAAAGWLIAREARWMARGFSDHARPALTGLLLGMALTGIATEPFAFLFLGMETLGVNLSWWALFPLLSIGLAAFAAYGAYRVRSAGLTGFAILAALLHLSRFYYMYGTTLLWKSLIMLCVGAGLLALGVWLRRRDERGSPP